MSNTKKIQSVFPQVDMGATFSVGSDRYPGTIVQIFMEKMKEFIVVQEDDAIRIDNNGFSESQEYQYSPNKDGRKYTYRKEKDGSWQSVQKNENTKRWNKSSGLRLSIGARCKYHDFSF